jgi:hypothetical protein
MMIMGVVHIYERRMLDVDVHVVSVVAETERMRLEARTAAAAPRRDDEGRL